MQNPRELTQKFIEAISDRPDILELKDPDKLAKLVLFLILSDRRESCDAVQEILATHSLTHMALNQAIAEELNRVRGAIDHILLPDRD